jgi:hypothetical protein
VNSSVFIYLQIDHVSGKRERSVIVFMFFLCCFMSKESKVLLCFDRLAPSFASGGPLASLPLAEEKPFSLTLFPFPSPSHFLRRVLCPGHACEARIKMAL